MNLSKNLRGSFEAKIGLSEKEADRFSLSRRIAAELDPGQRQYAGFELEVTGNTADALASAGTDSRGIRLPTEITERILPWLSTRALTASGGIASGGALVQSTILADSFIAPAYNVPQVAAAGATVLTGLVGNTVLPKMATGVPGTWITPENTAVTSATPTLAQVTLAPKDLGAVVDVSRRLILQSNPGADQIVQNDLANQLAIALDAAAINGTGASGQPLGVMGQAGVALAPVGTNGGIFSWALATTNIQNVLAANRGVGRLGWLMSGQAQMHCRRTVKVASYPSYLIDGDSGLLAGYPVFSSQNVPFALTKGTGTNLTAAIFGNWSDLIIGVWGSPSIDLIVDRFTFSNSGAIRITAFLTVDVQCRFGSGFSMTNDILPS